MKHLEKLGYDVKDLDELDRRGCDDEAVIELAHKEGRMIITLDLDFGQIYYFSKISEVGIIVLRLHSPTVEHINQILENFLKDIDLDDKKLSKSLIIVDEKKFRVRRF